MPTAVTIDRATLNNALANRFNSIEEEIAQLRSDIKKLLTMYDHLTAEQWKELQESCNDDERNV